MKKLKLLKKLKKTNPTPELMAFFQRREELKQRIWQNRKSVESILDYAMGFKVLPSHYSDSNRIRTAEDDKRMLNTFKVLHEKNREFRKCLKEELDNVKIP